MINTTITPDSVFAIIHKNFYFDNRKIWSNLTDLISKYIDKVYYPLDRPSVVKHIDLFVLLAEKDMLKDFYRELRKLINK